MQSLMQRYSATQLGEIFADESPVSVFDPTLRWMDLPDTSFLFYAQSGEPATYSLPINDPRNFHEGATFLLAQSHRIWLTLKLLEHHLPAGADAVLLDLGAYPFTIDVAIRHLLRRDLRMIATYAQNLSDDFLRAAERDRIELLPVNLDPRVIAEPRLEGMTDTLRLPDDSVDVVLFAHVIEHLYHPIQILRESFRVLKPGGKLILTTDHGFLLGGLLNYLNGGQYVHEPVESTAAMTFNEWRGHVRFYTEADLRELLEAAGGSVIESRLYEVLYNSVPEKFFVQPNVQIPQWRARLLSEFPSLRNEIMMVAQKANRRITNPLDVAAHEEEFKSLAEEFASGETRADRATLQDFAFGSRLLLGRWPTEGELTRFQAEPPARGLDGLLNRFLLSPEFSARSTGAALERPGRSCIIMTETKTGLRFFFSAQDTFVGFPVAVGVFERDVCEVLSRLLRPGMICVDMGANFGFYSITMAAAVGSQGHVYSFEPEAFNYSLLLKNRAENRMQEIVTTYHVACGDRDSEAELRSHPNPSNFGGWFLGAPDGMNSESEKVSVRRADGVLPAATRVDLVKIDVEGYELAALRGLSGLTAQQPTIICEFHTDALIRHGRDTPAELLAELARQGYLVYEASHYADGQTVPFTYDGERPCFANLVCIPGDATRNPL